MRKILVTSALPYANGPIHLGHMVEYIQTDIWARFQRMVGNSCLYICGDDAHGTPIMLSAISRNITPEQLVAEMQQAHKKDFDDFYIEFDNYYTTHSPENREFAESIYKKLRVNGDIEIRPIMQAYDAVYDMFLPDRYVKGECPRCGALDQYGDSCEVCGATYSPTELKNPKSVVSNTTPIQKESEHYFFKLDKYAAMLKEWINSGHTQPEIAHKLNEWFEAGLKQWDIARDAPYFGFEIPDAPNKYFYVWLDAPMGYLASLKNLSNKDSKIDFDDYWKKDSTTEVYHFIGKDLIYFHALFWPAILSSADFRKPTAVYAHGFLTVNGAKMSKSRGTFIRARDYLEYFDPEALRYYFAAKLNNRIDDLDLNFADFVSRVNSDLVGKVVNIGSRSAGFITKQFNGKLAAKICEQDLFDQFVAAGKSIAEFYEARDYNHAIREIMMLADKANFYIDEQKPWVIAKEAGKEQQLQQVCTLALNFFRILILYLKPVLPNMAKNVEEFLNIKPLTWNDLNQPLLAHTINQFKPLMQRINTESIDKLLEIK